MSITLTPDIEAALTESARRQGVSPEALALNTLRERFAPPRTPIEPQDEWERRLFESISDCGVALSNLDVSSEGLYD